MFCFEEHYLNASPKVIWMQKWKQDFTENDNKCYSHDGDTSTTEAATWPHEGLARHVNEHRRNHLEILGERDSAGVGQAGDFTGVI